MSSSSTTDSNKLSSLVVDFLVSEMPPKASHELTAVEGQQQQQQQMPMYKGGCIDAILELYEYATISDEEKVKLAALLVLPRFSAL